MTGDHTQPRSAPLDGLRAVAVLAVLLFHTGILPGGSVGVDVFFVLSGYLITSLLAGELAGLGSINVGAFVLRRARRLLPGLAVFLLAFAAVFDMRGPGLIQLTLAATYTMNIADALMPKLGGPLSHTWSLAVEWQFYLIWPLAITVLLRWGRRRASMVLVLAWAAISVIRALWDGLGIMPVGAPYYMLHPTGLLLGSAVALARPTARLGWVGLALLAAVFLVNARMHSLTVITAAEIATALIVTAPPRVLGLTGLRGLGRISYGVYLWHVPVWWFLGFPPGPAGAVIVAAASIAAAALSWFLIERPCLLWRPRVQVRGEPMLAIDIHKS